MIALQQSDGPPPPAGTDAVTRAALRKATLHLVPLIALGSCYQRGLLTMAVPMLIASGTLVRLRRDVPLLSPFRPPAGATQARSL